MAGTPAPGTHRPVVAGRSCRGGHRRRRGHRPQLRSRQPEAADHRGGEAGDRAGPDAPGPHPSRPVAAADVDRAGRGFRQPARLLAPADGHARAVGPEARADSAAEPPYRDRPACPREAGHHPGDRCAGPAELAVHAGEQPAGVAVHRRRRSGWGGDQHQRGRCADRERHHHVARWPRRAECRARSHQPAGQRAVARCQPRCDDVGELQRHAIHPGRRVRPAEPAARPAGRRCLAGAGAS